MKILINLLLEGIAIMVLFNILTMLLPKPLRKGLNGTIHLLYIISSILFKATINTANLVNEQAKSSTNYKKHKPSKHLNNNIINLHDKKLRKES